MASTPPDTADRITAPDAAEPVRRSRMHRVIDTPCLLGVLLGAFFFAESVEPSLLVRSWLFQGIVSGVSVAVGYGLGVALTRLGRWLRARHGWGVAEFDSTTDRRARGVLFVLVIAYLGWVGVRAVSRHEWTWARLGYERSNYWLVYGGTLLVTVTVVAVLLGLGWLLRRLWQRLTRVGARWLPVWVAGTLAFVLVTWAVLASLNNFVLQRSLDGFNATFAASDLDLDDAPDPPTSTLRSGGPDSEVAWDEAGEEGRRFLTRGPDAAAIAELTPDSAVDQVVEPIRVFVGRAAADSADERTAVAMAELERFGAFDRAVVLVVVPTGTGWVNEQIVQPLEYFHGGDIATVAIQYSHLPSPLAFLAESAAAGDTGASLIEAVRERIDSVPGSGPALYVAGESLGSSGGSRAFASLADSRAKVDGALWVGPPETMHLRREAERVRRPGSLQVRPVVGDGSEFVFVNRDTDLAGLAPHSVFLQQADDAIVWWDWDTVFSGPDWLREPLDPAVNPEMSWTPLTTFLHLAVDMAVSNDFDEDHGHKYGTQPLTAWRAVLQPEGWDDDRVAQLRERLEREQR